LVIKYLQLPNLPLRALHKPERRSAESRFGAYFPGEYPLVGADEKPSAPLGSGINGADPPRLVGKNGKGRTQGNEVDTAVEAEPQVAVAILLKRQHGVVLQAVFAVQVKAQLPVRAEDVRPVEDRADRPAATPEGNGLVKLVFVKFGVERVVPGAALAVSNDENTVVGGAHPDGAPTVGCQKLDDLVTQHFRIGNKPESVVGQQFVQSASDSGKPDLAVHFPCKHDGTGGT